MSSTAERREVHYEGRVQGVGFRYTTRNLARRFNVTGYVKNLSDGRVELVVEGPPDEIEGLLTAVADAMGDYIRSVQVDRRAASGEFHDFQIRY